MLEKISKRVVRKIGEDINKQNTGKCGQISIEIKKQLDKLGIESNVIYASSGKIVGEKHPTYETHYYVLVLPENLIIDTQLWQINKQPKDINKRQSCIFV